MAVNFGNFQIVGAYHGTTRINAILLGTTSILAINARSFILETVHFGSSAHSFLADSLSSIAWSGGFDQNFIGFSSLQDRWSSNGVDRTGTYTGALWVTEFTDLGAGWPAIESAGTANTLQYLYWYALTAQAKGCSQFFIYLPWTPEGQVVEFDGQTMERGQYWVDWLRARPELEIGCYAIPIPLIARDFASHYTGHSIFVDGLHINRPGENAPYDRMHPAIAQGMRYMMLGTHTDDPEWTSDFQALVDIVMNRINEYEFTGMGGTTRVPLPSGIVDPLPSPLPLP